MKKINIKFCDLIDKLTEPISRISLFIIYFWFGVLKIIGLSAATPLVKDLFECTLCGIVDFPVFYALYTLLEIIIGILFLFPKLTKLTFIFFSMHMFTTLLPLILLPEKIFSSFGILTMEGQYIIKNLALISLALFILRNNKTCKY